MSGEIRSQKKTASYQFFVIADPTPFLQNDSVTLLQAFYSPPEALDERFLQVSVLDYTPLGVEALDAVDLDRDLPQDLSEQAFRIGTKLLEDQILKAARAR
jgi:hypothetical protein